MTNASNIRSKLQHALEELASAGEAARLQLHLLQLEARERKSELAQSLEHLEQKLDRSVEQALSAAAGQARSLTRAVRDVLGEPPASPSTLTVATIMSEPAHTCQVDDFANRAAQILWDFDCGALPVLDREGKPCGMITDRDICMAAYTKGLPLAAISVRDVMSRHVYSCSPGDSLQRAVAIMAADQVRRLPVVDGEGRLAGVVALADIARSAELLGHREAAELVLQLLRRLSRPWPEARHPRQAAAAE